MSIRALKDWLVAQSIRNSSPTGQPHLCAGSVDARLRWPRIPWDEAERKESALAAKPKPEREAQGLWEAPPSSLYEPV